MFVSNIVLFVYFVGWLFVFFRCRFYSKKTEGKEKKKKHEEKVSPQKMTKKAKQQKLPVGFSVGLRGAQISKNLFEGGYLFDIFVLDIKKHPNWNGFNPHPKSFEKREEREKREREMGGVLNCSNRLNVMAFVFLFTFFFVVGGEGVLWYRVCFFTVPLFFFFLFFLRRNKKTGWRRLEVTLQLKSS